MQCDDLIFGLVAIYAVPQSKSKGWWQYPWNVPYSPDVASITPAQLGHSTAAALITDLKKEGVLLTNQPDNGDGGAKVVIYCDEKMSLQCKHKRVAAGIQWTNTVKATAIQPYTELASTFASFVTEPHDLFCVGDNGLIFCVRAVEEAYEGSVTKKASENGWTQDVQFQLLNCHAAQELQTL